MIEAVVFLAVTAALFLGVAWYDRRRRMRGVVRMARPMTRYELERQRRRRR